MGAGPALDAGKARPLMTAGALLSAVCLLLGSRATDFWQLAVAWVGVSLGAALFGPLAANSLVTNWFVRKQGIMLGLAESAYMMFRRIFFLDKRHGFMHFFRLLRFEHTKQQRVHADALP